MTPIPESSQASGEATLLEPAQETMDYIHAVEDLTDPVQRDNAWRALRQERDLHGYLPNSNAEQINRALLKLIQEGRTQSAKALMTPSTWEVAVLGEELLRAPLGEEERQVLNDAILDLQTQKAQEFNDRMLERGLDSRNPRDGAILSYLRDETVEAEEALEVPQAFWKTFDLLPYEAQQKFLKTRHTLRQAAEAVTMLNEQDLLVRRPDAIDIAPSINDPDARQKYAESLKQALDALGSPEDGEEQTAFPGLEEFEDPLAALKISHQLGVTDTLSLRKLLTGSYEANNPTQVDPNRVTLLTTASQMLTGPNDENRLRVLTNLISSVETAPNPAQRMSEVQAGLALFGGRVDHAAVPFIVESHYPLETAQTLAPRVAQLETFSQDLKFSLSFYLKRPETPPDYIARIFSVVDELERNGLSAADDGLHTIILGQARTDTSHIEMQHHIEDVADRRHMDQAVDAEITRTLADVAAGEQPKHDRLQYQPQIEALFQRMGIPPHMGEKLYLAWSSYNLDTPTFEAAAAALGVDEATLTFKDLTRAHFEKGFRDKTESMHSQIRSLRTYIRQYGVDEAIQLHNTFNTANFTRSTPEAMHNQLARWASNEAPKNICVGATSDNNTAFRSFGTEAFTLFGEEGTFLFECNTKAELAAVMVTVGKRDRAQGRDPLTQPTVETVMIGGHGSPESINIGPLGEYIKVSDYVDAAQTRDGRPGLRPNDYARHLGRRYRMILVACEAAQQVTSGHNIAETMSVAHGVVTHGSPKTTTGMVEIDAAGNVSFNQIEGDDVSLALSKVYGTPVQR